MRNAIAILFALGSIFFTNAKALTIINADAFAPGDGKAIYDTTSGLTWLDFGINNGVPFYEVLDQLGVGQYAAWRLPTESEVLQLFNGLIAQLDIPDTATEEDTQAYVQVEGYDAVWSDIYALWGVNDSRPDEGDGIYSFASAGLFLTNNGDLTAAWLREFVFPVDIQQEQPYYVHILWFGLFRDRSYDPDVSTLLVRDVPLVNVPEPAAVLLLFFGLAAIIVRRIQV